MILKLITKYLAVAAALVTMAACSKSSEPITEPEVPLPLSFNTGMNEGDASVGTRAATPASDHFTEFKVCGFKMSEEGFDDDGNLYNMAVFPAYDVKYLTASYSPSNTTGWEYVGIDAAKKQTIKYWDFAANQYQFFAYAYSKDAKDASKRHKVTMTPSMSPEDDNITATRNIETASLEFLAEADDAVNTPYYSSIKKVEHSQFGNSVQLAFQQPFYRIRFSFKDENGIGIDASPAGSSLSFVKSPQFGPYDDDMPMVTKSNIKIDYPLASDDDGALVAPELDSREEIVVDRENDVKETTRWLTMPYVAKDEDVTGAGYFRSTDAERLISGTVWEPEKWYTLVATGEEQGAYKLTIDYNCEERTAYVPAEYTQFVPGYNYTFVFKVTSKEVSFSADLFVVTKWQSGDVFGTDDNPVEW